MLTRQEQIESLAHAVEDAARNVEELTGCQVFIVRYTMGGARVELTEKTSFTTETGEK